VGAEAQGKVEQEGSEADMIEAIKLGCGFQLGRALYGLGIVGAIVLVIAAIFSACIAHDAWKNWRRRSTRKKGGSKR
jgi:hypothetical protein